MSDSLKVILDTMLEKGVKNISVCLSCKCTSIKKPLACLTPAFFYSIPLLGSRKGTTPFC